MVKPYYERGGITIYHGDCRDILCHVGSVDAVVTDPPYGVSREDIARRGGHVLRRDFFEDDTVAGPMTALGMAIGNLSETGSAIVWCGHRQFGIVENMLRDAGMQTSPLVWRKTNPVPSVRKASWRFTCEFAVAGHREGGFIWNSQGDSGIDYSCPALVHGHPEKTHDHPTPKALALMLWCIRHCSGDTILDPFMGSGTTLRAAKDLGRRAIGIEIEERYCEIAAKRLAQEVLPFGGA